MSDARERRTRHPDAVERTERTRIAKGVPEAGSDHVAREEPLEIQVNGTPVAVVMRTPGHDLELATGFLLSEGVLAGVEQLASLHHESHAAERDASGNVVRATLREGLALDLERLRRNVFVGTSCGVCGKATREAALRTAPPLAGDATTVAAEQLYALPEALRRAQAAFDETGGLHAAGLFRATGELLAVREDVGRHNAVDKVIGWAARAGRLPLAGHVLLVSGRISFEIVQKALAARIPVVAAVSAPSSLAIELAADAGIALAGFLRGRSLNVYGARERVLGTDPPG